jgi:hypothetical protein
MTADTLKILFIGGNGRSGSTILGRVLDEAADCLFVGELDRIWAQQEIGRICACGKPYRECALWSPVFERAFGGFGVIDAAQMQVYQRKLSQDYGALVFRYDDWSKQTWVKEYQSIIERLYRAIWEVSGCRLLIDSSKGGAYSHFLSRIPGFDLHFLHLIRDPRAVLSSYVEFWGSRNIHGYRRITLKTILAWNKTQLLMEIWGRFLRGRAHYRQMYYETYLARPQANTQAIFDFVGLPEQARSISFKDEKTVYLQPSHSTGGNARSNAVGDIVLKPNNSYRTALSVLDRRTAVMLSLPLMIRHGYLPTRPAS